MPAPEGWDAATAVAACPVLGWEGRLWRAHARRYPATDPGGSLRTSGRYHRGRDQFPEVRAFSALYLSTGPEICLGEVYRHVNPELLGSLNNLRVSELSVRLTAILDCRDPEFYPTATPEPREGNRPLPSQIPGSGPRRGYPEW